MIEALKANTTLVSLNMKCEPNTQKTEDSNQQVYFCHYAQTGTPRATNNIKQGGILDCAGFLGGIHATMQHSMRKLTCIERKVYCCFVALIFAMHACSLSVV